MHSSLNYCHRIPTYAELVQDAVIHATDTIKQPNIIATQLRNTPQLTRFDVEKLLDISSINSNAMKQNIQQTAYQIELQPVARSNLTVVEQFDMADTEEAIQEQLDEGRSSYETYKNNKERNTRD